MSSALASSVAGRFESLLGSAFVRTESSALSAYCVDGVSPFVAVQPETAEQVAAVVRVAIEEKL
jgi:FAD/FMN-containing dehydrogenase